MQWSNRWAIQSLEFILNNTSNKYNLQSAFTANGFIGTITGLSQVYLTLYDTEISPYTYTGSENIDITDNQISLKLPMYIHGEFTFHPRMYNGTVFDMTSGTDYFAFRQNRIHGGAPIVTFNSQAKHCNFVGDVEIPNYYASSGVDALFNNVYGKTYIDNLISNYYDVTYIDNIDNELSALMYKHIYQNRSG